MRLVSGFASKKAMFLESDGSMALMLLVGLLVRAPGACLHPYCVNNFNNDFHGHSIFQQYRAGMKR